MADNTPRSQNVPDNQKSAKAKREYRGLLNVLHSFLNQYKTNSTNDNERSKQDSKWIKAGAIAAIIYSGLTVVIIVAVICQAWTARDQEQRQLRAYIGIDHIDVDCCGHVDEYSSTEKSTENVVHIYIKNVGQTPASDVRVKMGFVEIFPATLPFPDRINFALEHSTGPPQAFPRIEASRYMLPEDKEFYTATPSPTAIMRAQNGLSKVVLFGHIEFTDVFGTRHYVDFCELYFTDYFGNQNFETCPQHNGEE